MREDRWALQTWFMIFVAFAITILFVMAVTALWRRNFREMIILLALGTVLALIFYRRRLALLTAAACALIVVNAGLTAIFHPSIAGILLTLASGVGMVFALRSVGKQHPNLSPDDWQKVFERSEKRQSL